MYLTYYLYIFLTGTLNRQNAQVHFNSIKNFSSIDVSKCALLDLHSQFLDKLWGKPDSSSVTFSLKKKILFQFLRYFLPGLTFLFLWFPSGRWQRGKRWRTGKVMINTVAIYFLEPWVTSSIQKLGGHVRDFQRNTICSSALYHCMGLAVHLKADFLYFLPSAINTQ